VIMEEVRKQVKAALDERETEVKRLQDKNQELRQVVFALTTRESEEVMDDRGPGTLMDGSLGLRGVEPRGNPSLERQGAQDRARPPPGLPAQSSVPGAELPSGGAGEAPPGLERLQIEGGGRVDRPTPPAGLPAQSPVPGGNPRDPDGEEASQKHLQGPAGISVHGEGFQPGEGEGPGVGATFGEDNAMVDHLYLLVQGMRQLQQLQMNRKDPVEAEAVKGSVELQRMPEPGDAAVEFNDWLYITEQQLGALTDNTSSWFAKCLACAREAYVRYQGASALERLSMSPTMTEELKDAKWFRLERRVLSLLLAAMSKAVREDTITHRVESVAGVLYRLHVLYQPGGAMERTAILKHLEGAPGSEDPGEVVTQLRRWRRYLARAEEMSIALPDASLQLQGIEKIMARVLEKFADGKFRLALARNELRLSSAPTSETVLKYYQHALAELQQVTPNVKNNQDGARLKGANTTTAATPGTGGSGSPTTSPKKGKNPCKFFQSEAGCRRGNNCTYAHEFLSKADRKTRCWTCGATGHRQQSCPTTTNDGAKGNGKQQGQPASTSTANTTSSTSTAARIQASMAEIPSSGTPAPSDPVATTSTTTSAPPTGDEAAAHREEMKKLLKEASSMLSKIQLMGARVEDTNKATEELELLLRSAGMDQHGLVLLDSGASHPFRPPVDTNEFERATNVGVELADGQTVELRQTTTGTLLKQSGGNQHAPIVPLGSLVQQLGCSVSWSRRGGLQVVYPVHGNLKIKMKGSCPYISELEALRLIAEIEDKNLEGLQQATIRSPWSSSSTSAILPWDLSLEDYVSTGNRSSALRAMMDPSFPIPLETSTERFGFVGPSNLDLSDESGLSYLKALPVNRKMRRRLHGSRWIVHLYDGKNEIATEELKKLEKEDVVVLEIDLQRSKVYNMKGWNNIMRALLWAACRGQLEGVLGGPPRGGVGELRQKLMYLWMVAERGSVVHHMRSPFLFMEYPDEMDWWSSLEWRGYESKNGENGLIVFDKHSSGRPHRKVLNPSAYVLSVDVAGWKDTRTSISPLTCKRIKENVIQAQYIQKTMEDVIQAQYIQETMEDVIQAQYIQETMEEESQEPPLPESDRVDLDQKNDEYRKLYDEVYKEVGDSIEYQTLLYVVPLKSRQKLDVNTAMRRMYLQLRQEGPIGEFFASTGMLALSNELLSPVAVKSKVFGTGGSYDLDPRYDDGTFVTSCHVRDGLVDAEALVEEEPLEVDLPVPTRRLRAKARLALITSPYEDIENYARNLNVEEMYEPEDILALWERLKEIPRPTRRGAKVMTVKEDGGSFYAGCFTHGGVCGIMKMAKLLPNMTAYLVKAAKEITGKPNFGCVAIVENVNMGPHRDSHNQSGTTNTVTALTKFDNGQVWVEKSDEEYGYNDVWREVKPDQWKRGVLHELHRGEIVSFSPGSWHQTEQWKGRRVALLTYTPRLTNLGAKDEEELRGLGFELPPCDEQPNDNQDSEKAQPTMFAPLQEDDDSSWYLRLAQLNEDQQDLLEELQERSVTLRRLLEEEEILLEEYHRMGKQVTQEADLTHQLLVDMIEQTADEMVQAEGEEIARCLKGISCDTPDNQEIDDVEKHLRELEGELQVVLNIPLDQVKKNLELWVPAIDKELSILFKDGKDATLRRITLKEAQERERKGELTIVPSKLVFICKPPNQGAVSAPSSSDGSKKKEGKAKWRRKCRLVLCGNFAERSEGQSQAELYAAGASADSMRVALTLASVCYWAGAGSDINGAFLLAPWPRHMRRYAILPPKTLIMAERATALEA
ncbi:GIP, partial [Symbiodinium necroappetens]